MCTGFSFLKTNNNTSSAPWNRILWESNNFVVVPTLGSLVPGWVLIIPKQHFICLGDLDHDLFLELKEFKQYVTRMLSTKFGSLAVFEHGPAKVNLRVGCGVDHAHLHLVPLNFDLLMHLPQVEQLTVRWEKVSCLDAIRSEYRRGNSYLYVEQSPGAAHIAISDVFPSQLFRKVIAHGIGKLDEFDWRQYSQLPNVYKTIEQLKPTVSSNDQIESTRILSA